MEPTRSPQLEKYHKQIEQLRLQQEAIVIRTSQAVRELREWSTNETPNDPLLPDFRGAENPWLVKTKKKNKGLCG